MGMARQPGGDGYSPALGVDCEDRAPTEMAPLFVYKHWLLVEGKMIMAQIWDMVGQERYYR